MVGGSGGSGCLGWGLASAALMLWSSLLQDKIASPGDKSTPSIRTICAGVQLHRRGVCV